MNEVKGRTTEWSQFLVYLSRIHQEIALELYLVVLSHVFSSKEAHPCANNVPHLIIVHWRVKNNNILNNATEEPPYMVSSQNFSCIRQTKIKLSLTNIDYDRRMFHVLQNSWGGFHKGYWHLDFGHLACWKKKTAVGSMPWEELQSMCLHPTEFLQ